MVIIYKNGEYQIELTEQQWDELIKSIVDKRCVPIIGAGASLPWIPIGQQIAKRWAKEYDYPLDDLPHLPKVAQFLAIEHGEMFPKQLLSEEISKVIPPNFVLRVYNNTVHSVLADLHLPLYITTNYDHLMETVLTSRGKRPTSDFCKWNDRIRKFSMLSRSQTIFGDQNKIQYKPTEAEPLVYHLHGDIDPPESMVLTEEDYVIFLTSLSSIGSEIMLPSYVRTALANNLLLYIGYSLEDMTFQIIFRLISRLNMSSGVAVLLRPQGEYKNPDKVLRYMDKYRKSIFSVNNFWNDANAFATDLRNRVEYFYIKHDSKTFSNTQPVRYGISTNPDISFSPYVGPRPFLRTLEDQRLFFGRDHESDEIISIIATHRIALFYGKSAIGKTSLFNAKVIPALENIPDIEVLPASINITSSIPDELFSISNNRATKSDHANIYMFNTLHSIRPEVDSHLLTNRSLSEFLEEYFPLEKDKRGKPKTLVMIFDQFEEFFNLIPSFPSALELSVQQKQFFQQVADAVDSNPSLRIVFIIREDFLGDIDPFTLIVPEINRSRFRIGPLTKVEALMVCHRTIRSCKGLC